MLLMSFKTGRLFVLLLAVNAQFANNQTLIFHSLDSLDNCVEELVAGIEGENGGLGLFWKESACAQR